MKESENLGKEAEIAEIKHSIADLDSKIEKRTEEVTKVAEVVAEKVHPKPEQKVDEQALAEKEAVQKSIED